MGDMADDYAHQQLCESMPYSEWNPRGFKTVKVKPRATWKTRDGIKMFVSDMETIHIKNCIAMLRRNIVHYKNLDIDRWGEPDEGFNEWDYYEFEETVNRRVTKAQLMIKVLETELLKRI